MYTKIMHHFVFLIITFSSYALCIQNENLIDNNTESRTSLNNENTNKNYPSDIAPRELTNENLHSGNSFVFPDKYRDNVNNLNDISSVHNSNANVNNIMTNKQRENPNNSILNTRSHTDARTNINDNYNRYNLNNNINNINNNNNDYYPYQSEETLYHHQRQSFQNLNRNLPNVPNYYRHQTFRNPIYNSQLNYAHNHNNYLYNMRPNYNARPTPPPPILPSSSLPQRPTLSNFDNTHNQHQYQYQYQQYPETSSPGHYQNQQSTSSMLSSMIGTTAASAIGEFGSNFLNQFGMNSLANLFGNFGMPNGAGVGGSGVGGPTQLIKGLEDIARNDDLQCVPRLLCQTLGNPERRAQLPNFISSPAITSLIAALPVSSPALLFGQAALLGLSGGEKSCDTTYRRCPGNEDDLLYYLNNYRGGFFRFFADKDTSGGSYFSSSTAAPIKQSQFSEYHSSNYQTNKYQNDDYTVSTTTAAIPTASGLNVLANLVGFTGNNGQNGLSTVINTGTNTIGQFFTNIFSGYFGGQRSSKQNRTKREAIDETKIENFEQESKTNEKYEDTKQKHKKFSPIEVLIKLLTSATNQTKPIEETKVDSLIVDEEKTDEPEERILNKQNNIFAFANENDKRIQFPVDENDSTGNSFSDDGYRYQIKSELKFPEIDSIRYNNNDDNRLGKRINFVDNNDRPSYYGDTSTKMVFPDKTGTGNFRFDSETFTSHRYGKILNRPIGDNNNENDHFTFKGHRDFNNNYESSTRAPIYSNYNYEPSYSRPTTNSYSSYNANDGYYQQGYKYSITSSNQNSHDSNQNIYVTNSKGVVEYYINKFGNKVYV